MPNEICQGCKVRGNTVLRADGFWHLSCYRKAKAKRIGPDVEQRNRMEKKLGDERFVRVKDSPYWIHLDAPTRRAKLYRHAERGWVVIYL